MPQQTTRSCLVKDLTEAQTEELAQLTMRARGSMEERLRYFRARPHLPARVVVIREDGQAIAWTLIMRDTVCRVDATGRFEYQTGAPYAYFFVAHERRRQGLATRLLKRALHYAPDVEVCPSNRANRAFFAKHNCRPNKRYVKR